MTQAQFTHQCTLWWLLFLLGALPVHSQFPASLEIANPNPVGSGARALGQGNAFIAIADDATAASWNPGGLPQLQRPEISFAFETIDQREETNRFPSQQDSSNLQNLNYASLVAPFFHRNHNYVFSLNYLRLYRFDRELALPFTNSTQLSGGQSLRIFGDYRFDQEGDFAVIAPSFAVNVTTRLMLGLTVNFWKDALTGSSHFHTTERTTAFRDFAGAVAPFNPSIQENAFEITDGQSLVFGGLYRFGKAWTIGAVVKPEYTLNLDHEQRVTVIQGGAPIFRPDLSGAFTADLEFPWILGFGVAWRPSDPITVSGDLTWTDWSNYRFVEGGVNRNPIDGTSRTLRDTVTVRVGSEYLLILDNVVFPLRCGMGYDPAPAVGEVDDFFTVSLGAGAQIFNRCNIDLAWEYRWGNGVNADALQGFHTSQDVRRHRILASAIWYF